MRRYAGMRRMSSNIRRVVCPRACRPWVAALLMGLPLSTFAQEPAATIDYGFCGGKPVYPVIGVHFATFCGPRNQISLGRRGQLMWSFPELDGLRVRHHGVRNLTEEELARLQMLTEAAYLASSPASAGDAARYALGIDIRGKPIRRMDGVLVSDGSSAMALVDALRKFTPATPLLPTCRNAPPPDVVFSPTLLPAERHAALAAAPRHSAMATHAAVPVSALPLSDSGGIAVQPPRLIGSYVLVDQEGVETAFPGAAARWRMVFFGYTDCPDVCPMTMHKVAQMLDRLGPRAGGLDVFFISIDSARDRVPQMKAFVRRANARVTGLTGNPETLKALADEFGVLIRRYPGGSAFATLQHSSLAYLLDPQGALRRLYPAGATVEAMAGELARLLPAVGGATPASTGDVLRETTAHRH